MLDRSCTKYSSTSAVIGRGARSATWPIFINFPPLLAFVCAVCTLNSAVLINTCRMQTLKMHVATFGNDCISKERLDIEDSLETCGFECERGICALVQHGLGTIGYFAQALPSYLQARNAAPRTKHLQSYHHALRIR